MKIVGKSIPGVEITLDRQDARELSHILNLFKIHASQGKFGSGTSVENQIKFCIDLCSSIDKRID